MVLDARVRGRWSSLGIVLAGLAAGCGEGDEVTCGDGTRLDGDRCVADAEVACGDGTRLTDGVCLPIVGITCGAGTVLDGEECVPDGSGATLSCGEGTLLDGDRCIARAGVTCGEGTTLVGQECIPVDDTITCGEGTKLSDTECVPDESLTCGPGTRRSGDECVPTGSISCGPGTELDDDECVPSDSLACGPGTALDEDANECRPVTVMCGPGTRLQGDECVVDRGVTTSTSSTFAFTVADKGATSVVYFLDSATTAVHRYDLATDQFLTPYSLAEPATTMAVTQAGDAVYLGSPGGRINSIDTTSGTPSFLVAAPESVLWMAAVDAFVYTIDGSGSWETHSTYRRSNGERTFSDDWRNTSIGSAYAPMSHRIFTFRDNTSPNDIYYEVLDTTSGALGIATESPYHGDYNLGHPIRVSPDETRVYVSSGVIFSASDLTYVGSIGLTYVDLAFHGERLYVLRSDGGNAQLVVLDASYAMLGATTITGTPLRLFVHDDELTVFTRGTGSAIGTWEQDL